jgi:hypothetical protein
MYLGAEENLPFICYNLEKNTCISSTKSSENVKFHLYEGYQLLLLCRLC